MDAPLQRRVQRYGWDKAAACYEEFWARQLRPAQGRVLALGSLRAGARVLDVACGTGLLTFRAADAVGHTGQVVATDLSGTMIERVRDTAAHLGATQVIARRCDAEALDIDEGSVDIALCALGLMYVSDPVQALAQMRRALRPKGRVVVAVWGARDRCGWAEIFPIVERRVASEVCPLFFGLGAGDALRLALGAAGFVEIETERLETHLVYPSADEACGAVFAAGPVALAYSHFDPETRDTAHREYLDSVAPYRRGRGYEIPGEFVIARAQKPG